MMEWLQEQSSDDLHDLAHLLWSHARELSGSSQQHMALRLSEELHELARELED